MHDYPDIWLHVDAAWLGAAFSCPEFREHCRVPAINLYAESVCINFHKVRIGSLLLASPVIEGFPQWALVSVDCAGLWVRDRRDLTEALDITPPFLRSSEADAGSWRYFCLLLTPKSVTNVE